MILLLSCMEEKTVNSPSPLSNAFTSQKALAEACVEALRDSSQEKIYALQVTEQEYRDIVWANLTPADTAAGINAEMAWQWVQRDSRKAVHRILYDLGGQDLKLKNVFVDTETKKINKITIHRGVKMLLENSSGDDVDLKFMNLVVEINGTYKVIAFDD